MHGPSPSCGIVGTKVVQARPGMNAVRLTGRFNGRPLSPGTYSIVVVAQRGSKRTRIGRISVEVVPPGPSPRRGPGSAPVFRCEPMLPTPTALAGLPGAGLSRFGPRLRPTAVDQAPRRSGVLAAPPFQLFDHSSRRLWAVILRLLLYAALVIGGTALAVHLVRTFRSI